VAAPLGMAPHSSANAKPDSPVALSLVSISLVGKRCDIVKSLVYRGISLVHYLNENDLRFWVYIRQRISLL
jgi:hypothetical protein